MAQILPVDEVHILSTYVESILYGAFFIMYIVCIWVLVKRADPTRGVNKLMLLIATVMLLVATLYEAVSIQRDVEAFFKHKDGSPTAYYDLSSNFANLYQSTLFNIQILIGDLLLIYRMYIVYERRLIVIAFPIAICIAAAVSGSMVIYQFSLVDASSDPSFFTQNVAPWTTSITALSMGQNTISTTAIAIRLWWAGRRTGKWFEGRLWHTTTVFLESGLPYTLTLAIFTALHLRDQAVYDFAYYGVVPMAGISMTGLLIRVGLRKWNEVTGNSLPSNIGPIHPHKAGRAHRVESMVFTDPTQTHGTIMSSAGEPGVGPVFSPAQKIEFEKGVHIPLDSLPSRSSLATHSHIGEGHEEEGNQNL